MIYLSKIYIVKTFTDTELATLDRVKALELLKEKSKVIKTDLIFLETWANNEFVSLVSYEQYNRLLTCICGKSKEYDEMQCSECL